MKTSLQQSAVLRQDLRMNPRLYQAMDLLYMPLMDLQLHLKGELETNPFLELDAEEEEEEQQATEVDENTAESKEETDEVNWEDIILDGFNTGGTRGEYEELEVRERTPVEVRDLFDHLREQLQLLELTPRQVLLSEIFLGNIGDDGYLRSSTEEIVEMANGMLEEQWEDAAEPAVRSEPYVLDEAEAMLKTMQRLTPPGIAARDLRECLMLQLNDLDEENTLTYRLVRDAFDDLISHRWSDLAKRFGLQPKEIQDAADGLAKLDPKPGIRFLSTADTYVVTDLSVEKTDGEYRVFLNDAGMPRLRISQVYRDIVGDKKRFVGKNREFITEKLNSANWLIQAIEQRRQTTLKVANFIVDRQRDFFEKGVEHLKPLTLREVADVIEMHESTVSRVTSQKYIQTPRGVYPLKFFFSSSLETSSGEDASSRAVKAQLQKLVSEENPASPLTDSAIVNALRERGVHIARRTVAKYRDQLGILPARMRKRI
jgi:RNA polymerase sigma-54 factor